MASLLLFLVATVNAGELTPEYLSGNWCFSHFVAGGKKDVQNKNYEFHKDGTLAYQYYPRTEVYRKGSYAVQDGQLIIRPTLLYSPKDIVRVEENSFVLGETGYVEIFFERGRCGSAGGESVNPFH